MTVNSQKHTVSFLRRGIAVRFRRWWCSFLIASLMVCTASTQVRAAEDVVIQVRPGQTIQDIATEYLGDAALWQSVLDHNGLSRPEQVVPWMQLRIPATGMAMAALAINQAQAELSLATQAGGRLFAGGLLDQSKQKLDEAQAALVSREYAQARQLADMAYKLAQQARRVATSASNVAVQAVLQDFTGVVETQRPDELAWKRAELRMRLVEGERIRTLSNSSAEIVFKDNSRLRLNANSLAVIREMRQDALLNKNQSSVALIQGDVLAYLAELRETNRFDLILPDVRTYVQSRSFWVNRDERQTTRLAVYEGQIMVAAAGDSVVIRQNEGTTIRPQSPPERPRELLPAPAVRGPEDNRTFYNDYPTLRWSPVANAQAYRLEIAQDRRFQRTASLMPELQARSYAPHHLTRGIYFWRISAVDSSSFPGPPSEPRSFVMQFDKIPPFIVISYPRRLVSFTNDPIVSISGEMETGVVLMVNGQPIQSAAGDQFQYVASLSSGENRFAITARDSGGNETTVIRRIVRQETAPGVEVLGIESDELSFITNTPFFTMNGQTESGAHMVIWRVTETRMTDSLDVPARDDGNFTLTLHMPLPGVFDYLLEAVDRAGNRSNKQIRIVYDNQPPMLKLDTPQYLITREDSVCLAGRAELGSVVLVNQQAVPVENGRFSVKLPLAVGQQYFTVTAEDDAGNRSEVRAMVLRDITPPRLMGSAITPTAARGGEIVSVTVRATDDFSGLPRTARYKVAGPQGFTCESVLVSQGSDGEYVGKFPVPLHVRGLFRLEWVELSDLAGNTRRYPLSAR